MNSFFQSDRTLYLMPFLYFTTAEAFALIGFLTQQAQAAFTLFELILELFHAVLIFAIVLAYRKHEKNVMKALLGAVLMGCVVNALSSVSYYVTQQDSLCDAVFSIESLVLYILLFAVHITLGAGHLAKPWLVRVNWILAGLILLLTATWSLLSSERDFASRILMVVSEFALICTILCIETRVDSFKLRREEAAE